MFHPCVYLIRTLGHAPHVPKVSRVGKATVLVSPGVHNSHWHVLCHQQFMQLPHKRCYELTASPITVHWNHRQYPPYTQAIHCVEGCGVCMTPWYVAGMLPWYQICLERTVQFWIQWRQPVDGARTYDHHGDVAPQWCLEHDQHPVYDTRCLVHSYQEVVKHYKHRKMFYFRDKRMF